MKKIITGAAVALALVSCAKQEGAEPRPDGEVVHQISVPAPVPKAATPEEWKAALLSTYEESQVKDKGEGVTEFMAKFKLPNNDLRQIAFGQRDAFRKVRIYTTGMPDQVSTSVLPYVSIPDNSRPVLLLQPFYSGDTWIFVEKVSVMSDGEIVFEHECPKPSRDTRGGGVTEHCDILLEKPEIDALRKITDTSKVAVRLTGSKGYASVKKDGYNPLKYFVRDLQSAIAVYDLIDATVARKLPPAKTT